MKKQEKRDFVKDLSKNLSEATSLVLIDYAGMSVKMQQELKSKLSEVEGTMLVVKNTLFKIAANEAKYPEDTLSDTVLSGPTAMIITNSDPIAPIQILAKFAKEFEIPQMKVGIVEGAFQTKSDLEKLASLPSKEILLGQTVGAIAGPMYGLTSVLQANLQQLVYVLQEASKK